MKNVILLAFLAILASAYLPQPTNEIDAAVSYHTTDEAVVGINSWTSKGWTVKTMLSQSVATSISLNYGAVNPYISNHPTQLSRDKQGSILVVFEKTK